MNVIDYVNYYGDYSFDEKKFNEVDNIVFSLLSYIDFNGIVPSSSKGISISDASKFFSNDEEKKIKKNLIAVRGAIKLLDALKDKKRYKNIKMSNYVYIGDKESQFSAITFKIKPKLYYVSFEGTDELISGWEEDFKMAYRFPVEAQIYSKNYLNKNFTLKNCKIIVGGHSKGGNLALVSSMYSNYFTKKKIIKIYSNDGQGLRKAQILSKHYKSIKDRYIHIIPNYSIVGLLLRHDNDYIVVKSNKKGIMAHDAITWQVSFDHFEKEKLSRFSKVFDEGFSKWLDKYDDEKRKTFVKNVFSILYKNNIEDLTEIKLKKDLILGIIKSSKEIDPIIKEMTIDLFKVINKTNLEYPLF